MSKDIRFYHLMSTPLHRALGDLLLKATSTGRRAIILVNDETQAKTIDDGLWTFKQEAFLSHGIDGDPAPDKTIVWITTDPTDLDMPPNKADMLFLAYGADPQDHKFDLVCDMFDGHNDNEVKAARERWSKNKDAGHDMQYFQQTEQGAWNKKQ